MTFEEALKAMKDGKKVRRKSWLNKSYIYFSDGNFLTDFGDILVSFDIKEVTSDDWEVRKEEIPLEETVQLLTKARLFFLLQEDLIVALTPSEKIAEGIGRAINILESNPVKKETE